MLGSGGGEVVSELQPLAVQVLAVHVTSVGCERAFSVATRQLTPARARLTPGRHRKLTIIAMNNAARRGGGHADETAYGGDRADSAFDLVSDAEDGEDADEDVEMPGVDDPVAEASAAAATAPGPATTPTGLEGGFLEGDESECEEVELMSGMSDSEEKVRKARRRRME